MAQPVLPVPRPAPALRVRVIYEVEPVDEVFLLEEETMPESPIHDQCLVLLQAILMAWAARLGRDVLVARNLACRIHSADARLGVDPDLCLVEPSPPDLDTLKQLRLWEPRHSAPWLGIEVVSESTAAKDYHDAPVRYARLGTRELWVFDPRREGPGDTGGPFVLQVWRRDGDRMERIYAGAGPARSPELGAWLVVTEGGRKLRLADDEGGVQLWPTQAEAEAGARQQEAQRAALERAAREQAEAAQARAEREVAELRQRLAELEGRKGG